MESRRHTPLAREHYPWSHRLTGAGSPDRRAHPTTLWSALRSQGRRTGFRRAGEGHQAYVDGLTRPVMALAVFVYGCAILDALLTLLYLHAGGAAGTSPDAPPPRPYPHPVFPGEARHPPGRHGGSSRPISSGRSLGEASMGSPSDMGRARLSSRALLALGIAASGDPQGEGHRPITAPRQLIEERTHAVPPPGQRPPSGHLARQTMSPPMGGCGSGSSAISPSRDVYRQRLMPCRA